MPKWDAPENVLYGESGEDILISQTGNGYRDSLTGGEGRDTFMIGVRTSINNPNTIIDEGGLNTNFKQVVNDYVTQIGNLAGHALSYAFFKSAAPFKFISGIFNALNPEQGAWSDIAVVQDFGADDLLVLPEGEWKILDFDTNVGRPKPEGITSNAAFGLYEIVGGSEEIRAVLITDFNNIGQTLGTSSTKIEDYELNPIDGSTNNGISVLKLSYHYQTDGTALDDNLTGNDPLTPGIDESGERNLIFGYDGNDFLYGGGDIDTLNGGNDNDILDGQGGSDRLIGGNGSDTFVITVDTTTAQSDTILDFDSASDKIKLTNVTDTNLVLSQLSFDNPTGQLRRDIGTGSYSVIATLDSFNDPDGFDIYRDIVFI